MKQIPVQDVRAHLSELIEAGEPIEITRYGKPVAWLQPNPTVNTDLPATSGKPTPVDSVADWNAAAKSASLNQQQAAQAARDALLRNPKG